jgi:hypothetical protein
MSNSFTRSSAEDASSVSCYPPSRPNAIVGGISRVLPVARAIWPKLSEADVYQPVDKTGRSTDAEKRRYVVTLKFSEADQDEVDQWLKDCLVRFGLKDGSLPWRKDPLTGVLTLFASCDGGSRPTVVDANQNDVSSTIRISDGSMLKVYVTAVKYVGFGGGLTIRINSYQVLRLEQYASPFKREQGYRSIREATEA